MSQATVALIFAIALVLIVGVVAFSVLSYLVEALP